MSNHERIIGIDPGLAAIGWGFLEAHGQAVLDIDYGCIRTPAKMPLPERLHKIHTELNSLGQRYTPTTLAIEDIIFSSNQLTAIQVAQARGVCILAFAEMGTAVCEYSPPEIKRAVAGYGRATKEQLQKMLVQLLNLEKTPTPSHASDALATALCHLFHSRFEVKP